MLYAACFKGHLDVVRLLVKRGADKEKADIVRQSKRPSMNKFDFPSCTAQDGRTPLFKACQEGWLGIVELLLSEGVDIDRADNVSRVGWISCQVNYLSSVCIDPQSHVNYLLLYYSYAGGDDPICHGLSEWTS